MKAVAFHQAVNVTLGLPIIRTSPDHGTAIDMVPAPAEANADRTKEAIGLAIASEPTGREFPVEQGVA